MTKLEHKTVQYGRGHPRGDHCGVCLYWQPPHCQKVKDPMPYGAAGWCNLFKRLPAHQAGAHTLGGSR